MNPAELIKRRADALPAMTDLQEMFEDDEKVLEQIRAVEKMLYDDIANLVKEL